MRTQYIRSDSELLPFDHEKIEIEASVRSLNQAKVEASDAILVNFYDGPIRYYFHGPDPSATEGYVAYDGREEIWSKAEACKLKMIREGVTNGQVLVTYYKSR